MSFSDRVEYLKKAGCMSTLRLPGPKSQGWLRVDPEQRFFPLPSKLGLAPPNGSTV